MPTKPFSLCGGEGLRCAVGCSNGCRTLSDGGGTMEVLVEVLMVVVKVEALMMEVVVEIVEEINENHHPHLLVRSIFNFSNFFLMTKSTLGALCPFL